MPPADIKSLFYMLATSAMVNLGLMPNPVDNKTERNIEVARHTIDLLAVLQQKTQGHLTPEESSLLDDILYNLRMNFVKAAKSSGETDKK